MSNIPFAQLIQQVDTVRSAYIRDEVKLRRSGELIYFVSEQILLKANTLLEESQQSDVNKTDTEIDVTFSSFLESLTQQSISTSFLAKYLIAHPIAAYQRESLIKTQVLNSTEAINLFEVDLIESEVISLTTARPAHDEDINAWIDRVRRCLETNPKIHTMLQIVEATNLSIAQVFISLLFSDYELVQRNNFYGEIEIEN